MENPPLLVPSWGGAGCEECTDFSSEFPRNGGAYVNVSSEGTIGEWEEQEVLQASDRRSGDRFGFTVALDQVKSCMYGKTRNDGNALLESSACYVASSFG